MGTLYNAFLKRVMEADYDLLGGTVNVALINGTTAYAVANDGTEVFVNDVLDGGTTAQEFGGAGYSRKTLAGVTVTADNTDDEGVMDADDVSWSSLDGETIQGILVYLEVTDDTDSLLIGYVDDADIADLPLTTNGSQVDITWPGEGIVNLTGA